MSNLENYYGISVKIDKELDPFLITKLEDKAHEIAALARFDIQKFFVYIHHITIFQVEGRHFGSHLPVERRIEKMHIYFSVNKKQKERGTIMFYNNYVSLDKEKGVEYENGKDVIKRVYPGYLLMKGSINTQLITFVEKSLVKHKHRKIMLSIIPDPTKEYDILLEKAKKETILTNINLNFEDEVRLLLRKVSRKQVERNRSFFQKNNNTNGQSPTVNIHNDITMSKYENKGQVGAMGDKASAPGLTQNQLVQSFPENFDFPALVAELKTLRENLQAKKNDNDHIHLDAISNVIKAESAAENKEGGKVLQFLKESGKWVFDTAKETSIKIVAEIFTRYLGF